LELEDHKTLHAVKPDAKQNLLVGELKGKLRKKSNDENNGIDSSSFCLSKNRHCDIETPVSNFSRNIDNSPNVSRKSFPSNVLLESMVPEITNKEPSPKLNPKQLFHQIGDELKSKNDDVLKEISKVNLKSGAELNNKEGKIIEDIHSGRRLTTEQDIKSSPKAPTIEFDSGHCTARSIEMSDSDKNVSQPSSQQSSVVLSRKKLRKLSKVSKTWSSCSSGLENTEMYEEDNYDDDDIDESEIDSKPKVNLRDLLKKMKSFDSDTEDETHEIKSFTSQNDTVIRFVSYLSQSIHKFILYFLLFCVLFSSYLLFYVFFVNHYQVLSTFTFRNGRNTDQDDESVHLTDSDVSI